ncbi:MAG TPA: PAS domain S-box protein [Thermoanaerobaculia bacterium]|nr:PAS domain S-box protein [Thermoanaerobaculia bacterium]
MREPQKVLDFYAFTGSMLDAVVLADSAGLITYVNRVAEAIFGYTAADLVGQPISRLMPQRFVDAHNRGIERSRAGESPRFTGQILSLVGLRKDGTEFPIELSLTSWQTAEGKVHSGIIRDLTEQKKSAQRAETQQAITALIAESRTLAEAVARVIETICQNMDWEVGSMWIRDPRSDSLRCIQFWDARAPRLSAFEKHTFRLEFARGEGLPGTIWEGGVPIWWADLDQHGEFVRSRDAVERGLKSAFGFPIIDQIGTTVGVLEFFTEQRREPEPLLMAMMSSIGLQIGTLLDSAHAVDAVLSIVEQMQIGVIVYHAEDVDDDSSLRLISVNPAASKILGIQSDEMIGRTIDENFPMLREMGIPAIYLEVVQSQESIQLDDMTYDDARVTRSVFSVSAFPLPNLCVGVAFENITKRKNTEVLAAAERRVLERIVEGTTLNFLEEVATFSDEQTPGGCSSILLVSSDGATLEYAAAPGLPSDFLTATDSVALTDAHHPASLSIARHFPIFIESLETDDRSLSIRQQAIQQGFRACWSTPIITLAREAVGAVLIFLDEERSPSPHERGVVEFATRIAAIVIERRRSEEALQKSQARFRALIQNSADGVTLSDADGRTTYRSPTATRILGYEEHESPDQSSIKLVHPEDIDRIREQFNACVSTGASSQFRTRVKRKNGSWIWIEGTMSNLLSDENVQSIVINYRDITEQFVAEQTLRESEERFNSFMSHAPLVAFTKDAASRYIWTNDEFGKMFGVRLEDVKGKTDFELFDRENADVNVANDQLVLHGGRPIDSSSTMVTADGVDRSWLMIKFPLHLSSGEVNVGGVAIDVTERSVLEKKLEETERISGLGRLAANIAHEINNVLMGILPFAEVMMRRTKADETLQKAATHIIRSVERGRRITQEILAFTRATDPVVRPFNPAKWLEDIAPELQQLLGNGIDLRIVPSDPDTFVRGDAVQLQQVLTNLCLNARDAMNGEGTLTMTVSQCSSRDTLPFVGVTHPEKFIHFSIADTGTGIASDVIGHIFEPLFTTKREAGTGLGLAITHQLITKHGGEIHVESIEGKGTTFHILLPCAPRPVEIANAQPAPAVRSIKRVVLVEDERLVGEGLVMLLEYDGIAVRWVLTAAEAPAAIAAFEPDLLILDVGLPDMNGFDLYRQLKLHFPHLPTIFSTGHGDQSLVAQFGDAPVAYLLKPYEYETLNRAMTELIGTG